MQPRDRYNTIAITGANKSKTKEFKQTEDGSFVKISPMVQKTKHSSGVLPRQKSSRSEYNGSHHSGSVRSGRSTRSKRKGASLKAKVLPPDFAERVLNLELSIDQGNFNMETINDLLLLYSQAVEFYDGMNDEKYVTYEARIQNMLIRPDIAAVMTSASRDPEGYAKREAERKQALSSASAAEIAREKARE